MRSPSPRSTDNETRLMRWPPSAGVP